ncbi:FecR family protein [Flagellimonas olearia]|uniref:FecR family protein n=1 Tax=Flagellimonas olearia TaxID=552546 RepID=UPI0014796E96|nr:FecR domain-containing protein [Allomuricauda olearia]
MKLGKLIYKKLNHSLAGEEESEFMQWFNASKENQETFLALKSFYEEGIDLSDLQHLDAERAWKKLSDQWNVDHPKKYPFRVYGRYAAIFVGVLGLAYGYWHYSQNVGLPAMPVVGDAITLDLGNGNTLKLSSSEYEKITDGKGNTLGVQEGETLDYSQGEGTNEYAINTLSIPNGKRFTLLLSDGTRVHLNAGSSLRYPAKFKEKGNREVFLAGEAFFEVSKNQKQPFIVNSDKMDIKVLGTKFNVSAYPDDEMINTVLVEGLVQLGSPGLPPDQSTFLEPGFKAEWDSGQKTIKKEKVDTGQYTGWMEGKFIVREMEFKSILKKLERHYNISITNNNKALSNRAFSATFTTETIEEVLNTFALETSFEFEISDDHIIIK